MFTFIIIYTIIQNVVVSKIYYKLYVLLIKESW